MKAENRQVRNDFNDRLSAAEKRLSDAKANVDEALSA